MEDYWSRDSPCSVMQVTEAMIVLLIEMAVAQISTMLNTNLLARPGSQMSAAVIVSGYDDGRFGIGR